MSTTLKRIMELLPLPAAVVAIVLWATTSLSGKADAGRLDALEGRVTAAEVARAHLESDVAWMKLTLFAVAQRVGAIVPAPPNP